MKKFGINNCALKWFESYLDGRKQVTKVNGQISRPRDNRIGIPQGSIIGAILFIIYINDMPEVLSEVAINLFADDTLLYITGKKCEWIDKHNEQRVKNCVWVAKPEQAKT